ncbi:choice-of-anchor D domain-containing protein [Geotalea sp. SG265]|uniref:choice-of-anchor D domain-containing protein n=1 Tax=Geotalea sp. SG265 TaxID=2922867 RepID=UPI001FAE8BAF|nr:choice-of-anchor D domain-containing protein [Geotalea sp. SG265]
MTLVKERFSVLFFLMTFCFCSSSWFTPNTASAANQWTSLGPWNGDVECLLAIPPSTIYAGTHSGGVFKSSDGGVTWSAANNGLGNPTVLALVADPAQPATIYAGTYDSGIYKTTDGGSSWARLSAAPATGFALGVDPVGTIYAGTFGNGIYKSSDGGVTWQSANGGMTTAQVYAFAIDPDVATTLYAGTANGIFRSDNGGTSWSQVVSTSWTRDLAILAPGPGQKKIYAATDNGVLVSSDGMTWTSAGLAGSSVHAVVAHPANLDTVFAGTTAGIFSSVNGGGTWTPVGGDVATLAIQSLIYDPADAGYATLFSGTMGGGVFKSSNGGSLWQSTNQELGNTFIQSVVTDSVAPATVYIGTNDGLYKSTDGGTNWTLSTNGLANTDVEALLLNHATPSQLYAGTWQSGVFKSTDGGATWTAANAGISSAQVHALGMDGVDPQRLYVGTGSGIYISTNAGSSWGALANGIPSNAEVFAVLTAADSVVYAGTNSGFYRSGDRGVSWTQSNAGLAPCGVVYGLAADPALETTLYAATCGGIYKSSDGGANWSLASSGIGQIMVYNLTATTTAPVTFYAGTETGVFASSDHAATWSPVGTGLTNGDVYAFALSGTLPPTLYAGTWGGGVFAATSSQDISVSPAALNLGYRVAAQNSTTQAVTIGNGGASNLIISSIAVAGTGAAAFSIAPGTCDSLTPTIFPGGSCTVNVTFAPSSGQDYAATLDISSNSTASPVVNVALVGSGAYPLSAYLAGSGSGTISVSAPTAVDAGLTCAPSAVFCGAYPAGTSITLTPNPAANATFSGWSGCPMTMGNSCFISLNNAVNATATFTLATLQSLLDTAAANGTITLTTITYAEYAVMNRPGVSLTLSGGWSDTTFAGQTGYTTIQGALTIANGTLVLDNIQLL